MSSNLFDLSGRVVLVIGASRGIGRAIAKGLAQAGASVALCSRKETDLLKVAEEIRALGVGAMPGQIKKRRARAIDVMQDELVHRQPREFAWSTRAMARVSMFFSALRAEGIGKRAAAVCDARHLLAELWKRVRRRKSAVAMNAGEISNEPMVKRRRAFMC